MRTVPRAQVLHQWLQPCLHTDACRERGTGPPSQGKHQGRAV